MDHTFNYVPFSREVQQQIISNITNGWFDCKHYHGESCQTYAIIRCLKVLKVAAKIYLPIHIIPLLLYKRQQLKKKPVSTLVRATYHFSKSVAFVGLMAGILQSVICIAKNIRGKEDNINVFLSGFLSSWSLLLESHGRHHEIFLFGLPRGLEILAKIIKKHYIKRDVPFIETFVFALTMAVLNYYYQHDPKTVKQTVRKLMGAFWGVN